MIYRVFSESDSDHSSSQKQSPKVINIDKSKSNSIKICRRKAYNQAFEKQQSFKV